MKVKKLLSVLLLVVMIMTTSTISASASFNDVNDETTYNDAILTLQEQGIINGKSDGNFNPDDILKTGEWYAMLSKANGLTVDSSQYAGNHWAYGYYAKIKSFIPGYSALLKSDDLAKPIKLVDAIKVAMCSFGYKSVTQMQYLNNPFTDLDTQKEPYNANSYLLNAYYFDIIPGEYTDTIQPERYITRGEACQIIVNLQNLCSSDEVQRIEPEIFGKVNIKFVGKNSVTYYNDAAEALSKFSDEVINKLNKCGKIIVTDEDQSRYINVSTAASGCYLPSTKQIIVFTGNRPQSLLSDITSSLTHEIGHFIHYNMVDSIDKSIIEQSFKSDELNNFAITAGRTYCTTNSGEYFAEAISYYAKDYKRSALDNCDCQNILGIVRKYVK